jgi:hypothetical protein
MEERIEKGLKPHVVKVTSKGKINGPMMAKMLGMT